MGTITYINWTYLNNEYYIDIVKENGDFIYKEMYQWTWSKALNVKYSHVVPDPLNLFIWED